MDGKFLMARWTREATLQDLLIFLGFDIEGKPLFAFRADEEGKKPMFHGRIPGNRFLLKRAGWRRNKFGIKV
jgi:hypothetical protein